MNIITTKETAKELKTFLYQKSDEKK